LHKLNIKVNQIQTGTVTVMLMVKLKVRKLTKVLLRK